MPGTLQSAQSLRRLRKLKAFTGPFTTHLISILNLSVDGHCVGSLPALNVTIGDRLALMSDNGEKPASPTPNTQADPGMSDSTGGGGFEREMTGFLSH